ncbi:hypothetical protein Mal64_29030 [Pseudobythopirellula maris]|uniref:HAMP domain-containing protein n=1 Tax=Pseudobythopirellula maris TaxID=2527991 RepID=A0A5C5ZJ20_9BACT|nr:HAMP domain-containing protein [Pseudobythopirellula maris]TWT87364.1 hypothetical protein Mal64_29030 [Pseudobythopirellula maris]
MAAKQQRKKQFVDPVVQGALIAQAVRYWFVSLAMVGMLAMIGWTMATPGFATLANDPATMSAVLSTVAFAALAAVVVCPIALYDLMRMSHRFTGPMLRLRRVMRQSAAGDRVAPIRFRKGDFWHELAEAFNGMQGRINELEARLAEAESRPSSDGLEPHESELQAVG